VLQEDLKKKAESVNPEEEQDFRVAAPARTIAAPARPALPQTIRHLLPEGQPPRHPVMKDHLPCLLLLTIPPLLHLPPPRTRHHHGLHHLRENPTAPDETKKVSIKDIMAGSKTG
jgi:hypothetical protein